MPVKQFRGREARVGTCVVLEMMGPHSAVPWAYIRHLPGFPYYGTRGRMVEEGLIQCRRLDRADGKPGPRYEARLTGKGLELARSAPADVRKLVMFGLKIKYRAARKAAGLDTKERES